jgi:hypothetical protein
MRREGELDKKVDVSVLTRQTYQWATRDSRLCCGGSPDLEPGIMCQVSRMSYVE